MGFAILTGSKAEPPPWLCQTVTKGRPRNNAWSRGRSSPASEMAPVRASWVHSYFGRLSRAATIGQQHRRCLRAAY